MLLPGEIDKGDRPPCVVLRILSVHEILGGNHPLVGCDEPGITAQDGNIP